MDFEDWAKEFGILLPDPEARTAWEYQESKYNKILNDIEDLIIESDDSPKMILHEPFRSLLSEVRRIRYNNFNEE